MLWYWGPGVWRVGALPPGALPPRLGSQGCWPDTLDRRRACEPGVLAWYAGSSFAPPGLQVRGAGPVRWIVAPRRLACEPGLRAWYAGSSLRPAGPGSPGCGPDMLDCRFTSAGPTLCFATNGPALTSPGPNAVLRY
jgi:hypothetical protein